MLIVHLESDEAIRIISIRRADSDETDLFHPTQVKQLGRQETLMFAAQENGHENGHIGA